MGTVPDVVKARWRSRNLGGQAKHQQVVRVRRGFVNRLYQPLQQLSNGRRPTGIPVIWKGINLNPWQGQWTVEGPWITLPEVESSKVAKSLDTDNGSSTATVIMDNVAFMEAEGVAGVYHTIQRGFYSPQKGIRVNSRPNLWHANEWADVLNGGYQIEIWEGYGPDGDPSVTPLPEAGEDGTCVPPNAAIARTWTGLIDGCDIDSHPDKMTITARDFAVLLTDQRVIYQNKAPEIRSPVIFADRRRTLGESAAGYGPAASSTHAGYDLAGVLALNQDGEQGWVSAGQASPTDMEYIEMKLPPGSYDQFFLATEAPNQEMYVAIKATASAGSRWNGAVVEEGAWIGGNAAPRVPGTDIPQVNHYKTVTTGGARFNMGGDLQCSDGTVLRIYLTNLRDNIYDSNGDQIKTPGYVANVLRLWAYRYGNTADAPVVKATGLDATTKAQGWVLIDDVADIVRMVLVWCGFKEWDIDAFGWSLDQPFSFGQDQFFIDIITSVMNQANYLFYMTAPTDDDMSIGVPAFKKQRAVTLNPPIAVTVKDTDMLEALSVKWDMSNLPYSFRVRGAQNKKGTIFGQDLVKRYSGTYFPPWSGIDYRKISPQRRGIHMDHSERLAGVKRNYIQTQGQVISLSLNSDADCLFACVLTAIQYAMGETNATGQISGLPGIELNTAIVVIDEASGTNSRVWLNQIESDHNMGEDGSWHMTFQGSLLDTEDLNFISEDWAYVVFKYGMGKGV